MRQAVPTGGGSYACETANAEPSGRVERSSTESTNKPLHVETGSISVELQCTKRDLRDLAAEVRSIVSLLEVGTIEPSDFSFHSGPVRPTNSESALEVSSVTVIRTMKQTLAQLQERMSSLELIVDDTRRELAATRGDVVELRDEKFRQSGNMRLADAAIKSLGDRLAETEACVLMMAPHPLHAPGRSLMSAGGPPIDRPFAAPPGAQGTSLVRPIAPVPSMRDSVAYKDSSAPLQEVRRADGRDSAKWRETQVPSRQ
jgi:hypothetical protein